ncbi:UTRA domain-containing protein [Sphingosinithalassobacter sp. LHW66-3]|uniref:UTRA domain-containing protein n=1 Tax=Sphingosinithalassobacter sp. LHW66-3 TaxID=3424718 RepID=UPI003D6B58A1
MTIEERIRRDIEDRIRSGAWLPGQRIPFEAELATRYGCARATANKALTRLAREGLIERRRRAGSFVAQPQVRSAVVGVPDIAALLAERGEPHRWQLIGREEDAELPAEVTDGRGDRWLAVRGIHHAAAAPFGWEQRWIDCASVPAAEAAEFADVAPGSWLLVNVPWSEARHRVRAVGASPATAAALEIARGSACLQIERWTWRGDRPVTYVRQTFPGDRYDLVETFASG